MLENELKKCVYTIQDYKAQIAKDDPIHNYNLLVPAAQVTLLIKINLYCQFPNQSNMSLLVIFY